MTKTPKGKSLGRKVKDLIRKNSLSTIKKYDAFREAHPELNLASASEVKRNHAVKRWDW
jgi:hypothetical protein